MTALDYDFPLYTPGSRPLIEFVEAGERELLRQEVERTIVAGVAAAKVKVDKGQATPAEAERSERLFAAIAADLEAEHIYLAGVGFTAMKPLTDRLAEIAAARGFTWSDKVVGLRAEIAARRNEWPAAVDKGVLAPAEARQRLERLEAVHAHYWLQGFAFDSDVAELRNHIDALYAAGQRGPAKQEIAA